MSKYGWTMDKLHEAISNPDPKDGVQIHLQHLWNTDNAKSIFLLTGLDVTHLLISKL